MDVQEQDGNLVPGDLLDGFAAVGSADRLEVVVLQGTLKECSHGRIVIGDQHERPIVADALRRSVGVVIGHSSRAHCVFRHGSATIAPALGD